ncbi:hypothetical protein [Pelagicoccus sp. SDUM812002]|uniref:hypothetical protein n=1 Tax=Pelagicoccus sp. SDUM812002 TaxID=3041266 RepID=UPI0028101859|nr:hypothetical protein [Pelagicoccus sp. SDUM812002]MDQ8188055.1 hypothetical protein [Pelagicoccus sp. SDUM812002]
MKRIIPLFIAICALSISAKAGVVFDEVSGAVCSTQLESENSAVEVFIHIQKERTFLWIAPLKVYTEDMEGKKITTIIYKAATRSPTLLVGPQLKKQKEDAARLGVSLNPNPKDQGEIRRVLEQYESVRNNQE